MTGKKFITKAMSILFIIMTVTLWMQGAALAETAEFRLDIDSLNLQKGMSTNLVLSMINAKGAEVVEIKGLEDFEIVSGNQSTSTQIVNGVTTYQEDYDYSILPKSTGQFRLYGIVKYNGRTYQTNELQINVSETSDTKKGEVKDLFIKTILSDDEVFFGQKVVLAYELYSRYNIEDFGFLDTININDFIASDVPQDKLKAEYVYLDGNKYAKYEAKQTYLSPVKAGTFTIPAYKFQANVSTGGFFNSSKPFYLQTDSKELTVKPLPLANQPADFSGIVGKLNIEAQYNKQEVDLKDSLTLQVTLSGNCNLESLKKIITDGIPGFTVYETVKNAEESIENAQYHIKKEYEIILVPEEVGNKEIKPIPISYFNPESGKYEQAEIPGATITVNGEIPQQQKEVKNGAPVIETVKIDQVSYQPQNEGYLTIQLKKDHLFIGLAVFAIALLLAALVIFFVLYGKKQDKALLKFYRQIKNSKDQSEIYNLFNGMMKYRFNLSLKASSRDMIIEKLSGHEVVNTVLEIMDYMENEKSHSEQGNKFLKDKVKEIYRNLTNHRITKP